MGDQFEHAHILLLACLILLNWGITANEMLVRMLVRVSLLSFLLTGVKIGVRNGFLTNMLVRDAYLQEFPAYCHAYSHLVQFSTE